MTTDSSDLPSVVRLLEDGAWLQALARSVVADRATADDVAQDAAVIALTRPPRESGALRGWLRRVVKNLATDAHRGAARRQALAIACAKRAAGEDTTDIVARWEIRRQVVDAVLALEDPYRATLLLRFFEGLDLAEVAARQRVPVETVKTRQRRALDMLRARLAHLDDGEGRRGFAALHLLARPDDGGRGAAAHAAAATIGGIAMAALVKTAAVAALLAAAAGAWWIFRDDPHETPSGTDAAATDAHPADARTAHGPREKRPAGADAAGPPPIGDLSAFADFDADRDVRGRVVDRDDRPVADARVASFPNELFRWSLAATRGESPPVTSPAAEARSAADGSFRLRLAPGTQTLLRVAAKGLADVELPYVQVGQTLRVVLDPPTTLRVRVEDAGGTALADTAVFASSAYRAGERTEWMRSAKTGADGVVTWEGLPRGRGAKFDIEVSPPPGRAPGEFKDRVLEDRDVNETVVTLAAGRTIEGRVVDAESSIGVAGARIFAGPRRPPVAIAEADGRFHVDGWTAESRWAGDPNDQLTATADGFAPASADVPAAQDPHPLEVSVRRGFDVTGVVAGPDGRPVAGARVLVIARDRSTYAETFLDATTDSAGAFRFGWLPRRASAPLSICAAGFAPTIVAIAPPPKDQPTLDLGTICVAPGRTVRGRVIDEAGVAVAGLDVRMLDPKDEDGSLAQFRMTLDDGRFAFAAVGSGRHRVQVSGRGPDPMQSKTDIDVPADADPPPMTIVYGKAPPKPAAKVTLATRVVDEDGQPVAGVPFGVGYAAGDWTGVVKSGSDGTLDVACAQEPQYVSPRFEGEFARRYQYQFVWLRPGATAATIVLKRAEPISGTVVDATDQPVAQAWVEALVGSKQVGAGMADAKGRFSFGVPPGATVDLTAKPPAPTYPPPPDVGERIGVSAGSQDVTIRVARVAMDRSLDIVLVLPGGTVAGKCSVNADFPGADNRNPIKATFDATGRAHLDGLPRGPVSLRVQIHFAGEDETYAFTGLTPTRVRADAMSVRIVVAGFHIVRGRVVDERGTPSPGASVFSTAAFAGSGARADAQGEFALRLTSDAKAPFLVTAAKMPYERTAPLGGWDIVEDGADRELEIVVKPQPPR